MDDKIICPSDPNEGFCLELPIGGLRTRIVFLFGFGYNEFAIGEIDQRRMGRAPSH
jgi:hypothetical protein